MITAVTVLLVGLAIGYRPVVIMSGSMGEAAPAGSLVIAAPRPAADVLVGDVLVMERPGLAPITHRVLELEGADGARFAITKGDANEAADATPHPLDGEQLVGRWFLPGWGTRLAWITEPGAVLALIVGAVLAVSVVALRRIWSSGRPDAPSGSPTRRRRRSPVAMGLAASVSFGVTVSWAVLTSGESVPANDFATRACFDPTLGSVQSGTAVHSVDGSLTVAISPVDPTKAFALATVRSDAAEPADSTVRVRLVAGGSELEIHRATDAAVPPSITIEWSVVAYTCGVTVQHGLAVGNGTDTVGITIDAAPPGRSFALVTSSGDPTATTVGGADFVVAERTTDTELVLRSALPIDPTRSLAWQVVTVDDPGDMAVQHIDAALAAGETSTSVALPQPVDPTSTFVLTGLTTSGTGSDIGARSVRSHLVSSTAVEVSRQVGGEALDLSLQVVSLFDGSTVRHGTVDLAVGQFQATVAMAPVDPTRATAISTVVAPGPAAGGSTTMTGDDVLGEATATFAVVDTEHVELTRDAVSAAASFGWQVIEWAGPRWWDPGWQYRQRIDLSAGTAAAPGGYSVPITFDHAALVTADLARSDGDDLRVAQWDGSSWIELDRILDEESSWDTATTTVWFRSIDPVAASSNDTYWLYFGNATPPPPPTDPEAVFALSEDFESGTLGDFADATGADGWYEADPWTYRRPLGVDATLVPDDLTDFPLLVTLTDPGLAASAQPDGSDIRFVAADGVTLLDHEIEAWDPGTGSLAAWVRLPAVSSTVDTELFLYAGASDAPDGQQVRAVWSTGFDGVWHLADDPSGSAPGAADSGPRRGGGLAFGAMTDADLVAGAAGDALDLDGTDDGIEVPAVPLGASGSFTVSAWIRPDAFGSNSTIVEFGAGSGTQLWLEATSPTSAILHADVNTDLGLVSSTAGPLGVGTWQHVTATFDHDGVLAIVDGVSGTPGAASGRPTQSGLPTTLGSGSAGSFDGTIDEIRIDQTARPAAWIAAHRANIVNPAFVTAGVPESGTWLGQGSWTRRKPLVVEPGRVTGGPTDSVILVALDDPELAAAARADGADIVFTAADGVTRLDHVVESYGPATGSLRAWVSVPALGSADGAEFFVYYGNPGARSQSDPVAVFGPDADLLLLPLS